MILFWDTLRYITMCEIALSIGFVAAHFLYRGLYLRGMDISYVGFAALCFIEMKLRVGDSISWRLPISFISATISILSQFWLFRDNRRKGLIANGRSD